MNIVKPVHLQDNLSKTWLAQEAMDKTLEGAEKARDQNAVFVRSKIEEEAKEQAVQTEQKTGLSSIRSEAKNKEGKQRSRKRRKRTSQQPEQLEEDTDSLRLRRPEDDDGKGQNLDIEL